MKSLSVLIEVVTEESRIHQSHALNFWYANQNEMMELWKSNFRQELKKKKEKKNTYLLPNRTHKYISSPLQKKIRLPLSLYYF